MSTIQQSIRDTFLAKLAATGSVDEGKIEKLRTLMADGKRLKPDDIVKLFSSPGAYGLV